MEWFKRFRQRAGSWIRGKDEFNDYVRTVSFENAPDGGSDTMPGYVSEVLKMSQGEGGDPDKWDDQPDSPAPGMDPSELSLLLALFTVNPWVHAAADRTGSAISSIKLKYFKKIDGKKVQSDDTKLQAFLEAPNFLQTWEDISKLSTVDMMLVGWSLWEHEFERSEEEAVESGLGRGELRQVFRRRADRFVIDRDAEKYWKGVLLRNANGQETPIPPEKFTLFREWSPIRDYWPVSGLFAARSSVIWDLFATTWNTAVFKNGAAGLPEGTFETDRTLNERTYNRILKAIKNRLGHADVWRSILILDGGLRFKPTTRTMADMQFQELQDQARNRILVSMGVPPAVIGVPIQGQVGTFREQRHQFYQLKVIPLSKKFQSTINRFLAPLLAPDGKNGATESMEFDLSDILSLVEDLVAKSAALDRLVSKGILLINEVRDKELGLGPVDYGDVWWAPLGLAPVSASGRPKRPEELKGDSIAPDGTDVEGNNMPSTVRMRAQFCKAAVKDIRPRIARRLAGKYRVAFDKIKDLFLEDIEGRVKKVDRILKQDEVPQFDFASGGPLGVEESAIQDILAEEMEDPLFEETKRSAKPAAQALGVNLREFTDKDPTFRSAFDSWRKNRAASTAKTMSDSVREIAEQAREEGLSSKDAIKEIESKLNDLIEDRINDLANSDSTTVASTAMSVQAADQFFAKQWLGGQATSRNKAGAENHQSVPPSGMHEKIVLLDGRFQVPNRAGGLDSMDYPGDPSGSPENTSYCECSMNYLTRAEYDAAPDHLKQAA